MDLRRDRHRGTKGRPKVTPDQLRAHNTKPTGAGSPASTEKAPDLPPDVDTGPAPEQGATQENTPSPTHSKKPKASRTPESTKPEPETSESPSPSPSDTASADAAAAKGKTPVLNAEPTADAPHDSGSVLPVVAGAALVVLIGGAAFYAARRRRHE